MEQVNGKIRVTYSVQSGDNLWSLGQRFDCSVDELRRWNNLPQRKRGLQIGALLTIWPGPKAQAQPASGTPGQAPASPASVMAAGKT
jgi:membrane-bound lytic murein transglycosylase D